MRRTWALLALSLWATTACSGSNPSSGRPGAPRPSASAPAVGVFVSAAGSESPLQQRFNRFPLLIGEYVIGPYGSFQEFRLPRNVGLLKTTWLAARPDRQQALNQHAASWVAVLDALPKRRWVEGQAQSLDLGKGTVGQVAMTMEARSAGGQLLSVRQPGVGQPFMVVASDAQGDMRAVYEANWQEDGKAQRLVSSVWYEAAKRSLHTRLHAGFAINTELFAVAGVANFTLGDAGFVLQEDAQFGAEGDDISLSCTRLGQSRDTRLAGGELFTTFDLRRYRNDGSCVGYRGVRGLDYALKQIPLVGTWLDGSSLKGLVWWLDLPSFGKAFRNSPKYYYFPDFIQGTLQHAEEADSLDQLPDKLRSIAPEASLLLGPAPTDFRFPPLLKESDPAGQALFLPPTKGDAFVEPDQRASVM